MENEEVTPASKEEAPKLKTYEISFGHGVGHGAKRRVVGPYKDVLVEAASYEEARKKAAQMLANKTGSWVVYGEK